MSEEINLRQQKLKDKIMLDMIDLRSLGAITQEDLKALTDDLYRRVKIMKDKIKEEEAEKGCDR